MDCMELMRGYPDKHFELAIVDPPYGIKSAQRAGGLAIHETGRNMRKESKWKGGSWDGLAA